MIATIYENCVHRKILPYSILLYLYSLILQFISFLTLRYI